MMGTIGKPLGRALVSSRILAKGAAGALLLGLIAGGSWESSSLAGQALEGKGEGRPSSEGAPSLRTLTLEEIDTSVRIDGRLNEEAWSSAAPATGFIQQVPNDGEPATERTEVRMLVDGDALYVGARLFDSQADGIRAQMARRDASTLADWFYVHLDSYHDQRTAFSFGISAAGVQRDLRYLDDWRSDSRWNAVWDSEVTVDEEGWTVEMRIPLSQIRFNPATRGSSWGVNFERNIPRKNETSYWASVPDGVQAFVSLFGELRGVSGLEPSRRVEVLPYSVAKVEARTVDPDDPFRSPREANGSVGMDMKVGLGSSVTLSATVNPDFGQVEADPARVNLTAFEVYETERRPFFLEGSDIFQLQGGDQLFYSRRIGRRPHGGVPSEATFSDPPEATRILGAAKLSGKMAGGWSVGLLGAVTPTEEASFVRADESPGSAEVEPATSYLVGRAAREFRNGGSSLGIMATALNRKDGQGQFEYLHDAGYGLAMDGHHRFGGNAYEIRFSLLGSHVRGDTLALQRTQRAAGHYFQRPDAKHLDYDPARTTLSGFSASADLRRLRGAWLWGGSLDATSPGFEINDLGFNPSLDEISGSAYLHYRNLRPGTLFRNWGARATGGWASDFSGVRQSLTQSLMFSATLLNYWGGHTVVTRRHSAWSRTALRGGSALRTPGRWHGMAAIFSDRRKSVSGSTMFFWSKEDETGGWSRTNQVTVSLRPSSRFDLSLSPSLSQARQPLQYVGSRTVGGEKKYLFGGLDQRTLYLTARLNYTFSPRLSLEFYGRPFLATGSYDSFREVTNPQAGSFQERFHTYSGGELNQDPDNPHMMHIDRDLDGETDFTLANPSFNMGSFQMNAVLRWEFRPGSSLFLVWTQDRSAFAQDPFELDDDLGRLWDAPSQNVFLLKMSYWLGM